MKFISLKNFNIFFLACCFGLISLLSATSVEAASVSFAPAELLLSVNQEVRVDIYLDTENQVINAVSGKLSLPGAGLKLEEISDGNSLLSFWVEKPSRQGNEITFAGVTPGGYDGHRGLLFSLFFSGEEVSGQEIKWQELQVLANDGQGTSVPVNSSILKTQVTALVPGETNNISIVDSEVPEKFDLVIARDPLIFDNQWFLIFATQDKNSGVARYEVKEESLIGDESISGEWREQTSPYLLTDQTGTSRVSVKAIDRAGNETISILEPKDPTLIIAYWNYFFWTRLGAIIISVLVWLILLWWLRHRKK